MSNKSIIFKITLGPFSKLSEIMAVLESQRFSDDDCIINKIEQFYADGTEQSNSVLDDHLQELGFGQARADTDIEDMYLEDGTCILDIDYLFKSWDLYKAFEKRLVFVRAYHRLEKEENY